MRESCTSGSVRGVLSNEHPYRDRAPPKTRATQHLARRAHQHRLDRVGTARKSAPLPTLQVRSSEARRSKVSVAPAVSPHLLADGAGDARFAQLHRRCRKITRAAGDLQHKLGAGRFLELLALTDGNDE
jgi:hypothetical protein